MAYALAPLLTEKDEAESGEGGIDPLGLYTFADALGVRLVPGVRERQSHPRFLTAIAVSLATCAGFDDDDGQSNSSIEPWLVFEWYLVEGLVRTCGGDENIGLPGSLKASKAIADRVPLSAQRYLKTPSVFGFHGIYRLLARTLGVERAGRLGDVGFELLSTWEKEQGLEGFITSTAGPGQAVRRQMREAVQEGMMRGSTARGSGWSGWSFFRNHLRIYDIGKKEGGCIASLLLANGEGFRRDVVEFLVSPAGGDVWTHTESEREFHQALHHRARLELKPLLEAIDSFETFARLCQDAFDDCLLELTLKSAKTSPAELGRLDSVQLASQRIPSLFDEVAERLEVVGETARFRESFGGLAEHGTSADWAARLAEHHRKTQRQKPPDGKNPWFDRFDDGSLIIRPLYRRDRGGRHDQSYVHAYRTHSLCSFARDLKLIFP